MLPLLTNSYIEREIWIKTTFVEHISSFLSISVFDPVIQTSKHFLCTRNRNYVVLTTFHCITSGMDIHF